MTLILVLVYAAFIALGLPDGLAGVAWPSMRQGFGVEIDAVGASLLTGTAGYLLSSFLSGRLIAWLSIRGLLILSCALCGAALLGDCLVPAWGGYVGLGLLLGLGAGGIDAGLNNWVAARLPQRHMHWLHACYGVGVTLGPLLMTGGLRAFGSWKPGFAAVGLLQLALAAAFALSAPAWRAFEKAADAELPGEAHAPLGATLGLGRAWLGAAIFFIYAGAELGLGFWAYSILTEARGVDAAAAGLLSGSYYALFTVGRLFSGSLAARLPGRGLLLGSLLLALLGSGLLWLNLGPALSLGGLALAGLAMAPVFPCMISNTAERLGQAHARTAIGLQMAAAGTGAACLPALLGLLARHSSVEAITAALPPLFVVLAGLVLLALRRRPATARAGAPG